MATREEVREALTAELKTKSICRFCLTQGVGDLTNIYAKDAPIKSLLPLPVEIMAVASIEVFLNDGMPASVCLKCRLTFDYCYRFKQMCKKAESLLNQVPLLGEWPSPLVKPVIPSELLPKEIVTQKPSKNEFQKNASPTTNIKEQKPSKSPSQQNTGVAVVTKTIGSTKQTTSSVQTPRKILNSNPAPLPEPPIPTRTRKTKNEEAISFLTKIENNKEISFDDLQRLIDSEDAEQVSQEFEVTEINPTSSNKNKPKLLNKSSKRILNKEAEVNLEPRLKQPFVKQDEDGNVSIVTEILDPNEPYENEPDPIKDAEPVKTNVFPCPYCDRTFPLLQLRDMHLVNHTRDRQFPCKECDRSFFSKYDLQKHEVIHTGERKYKCTVCARGFTRPGLLYRHEKIHTDIPKFLCVFCEKTFLSKDDMEKHAERHRKNRPFKCKSCDKAFAFKQGLERHEVVHSTEQPYPCQYCDKSFCTPSKLARHLVAHAGKRPFPCKFCPKSYLLSHHLTRHLRTHKESVVMYSCNECEQVYNTCNELVLHSAEHARETLICPLCQQSFEDVETVTAHIKEHANDVSFPCEFCDLIFLTYNEQSYHVKSAHASDLVAYNEDEKNATVTPKRNSDEEMEETIEEFLYEEENDGDNQSQVTQEVEDNANHDNQSQLIREVEDITNQEEFDYTKDKRFESEGKYEEYLKIETLTSADDGMVVKEFSDANKDQQPVLKKSKLDTGTKVLKTVKDEQTDVRRKTPKETTENISESPIQKSPKAVAASTKKAIVTRGRPTNASKLLKMGKSNDNNKSSPTNSDKNTKTSPKVKQSPSGSSQSVSKVINSNTTSSVLAKEGQGKKIVKMQKIVVTKAEAAAMAKDGRIKIKDGNLILTSKPAK
uniref:Zinc finger protein 780A n=1 Tax=Ceratitis capitata TaxID=7213 RepID=W8B653_CERCA